MADIKRLDHDGVLFLVNSMFQKLASSPLAEGKTYTLQKSTDGKDLLLVDSDGVTATTLSAVLFPADAATKLEGIATGAEANVLEGITVNGTDATITSKKASITVPTDNATLTNGAGYQTAAEVTTLINTALSNFVGGISYTKVADKASLPAEGQNGFIYLVPNGTSLGGDSIYDEYYWDSDASAYEMFGTTRVDLTGYVLETDLTTISNSEITTIVDNAYNAVFNPSTP